MLASRQPGNEEVRPCRVRAPNVEFLPHTGNKSTIGGDAPEPGSAGGSIGSRAMAGDVFRTPDERFEGLPEFPFEPHYREVDGLRLAHLDEGEGRPVVFFHGEPTWSYLWRKVIPPVRDAGYRCIAPDYAGFGRSDKPTDLGWYSYDRHTQLMAGLLDDLDLREATAVVHDWGGPIGLRLAVEHPDWISRLVIMDSGLFTGEQRMSEAWLRFRDFVERTDDLPVSMLVRRACHTDPGDDVAAAYDAPFPTPESKAGASARSRLCAATSVPRSSSGQLPTRCFRSRSARRSPACSVPARRARSRTPRTSSRRTPDRRSGG